MTSRTTVRVAAAQTPEFLEDIQGALDHAVEVAACAAAEGAALLCFPEAFLQGYLINEVLARKNALELRSPAFRIVFDAFPKNGLTIVMGLIEVDAGRLFNTAVVFNDDGIVGRYRKRHLLKAERVFTPGEDSPLFAVAGVRFGINICYDTNFPAAAQTIADVGGTLLVCPANNMLPRASAHQFKDVHNTVRGARCRETGLWLLSADVTGERDDFVSWGPTAVLNPAGAIAAQLPLEKPGLLIFDIPSAQ